MAADAGLGSIVTGIGTIAKIGGSIWEETQRGKAAEAQAKAFDFEAATSERNAQIVKDQALQDEATQRVMARRAIGSMAANYAASGITREGSVLDVLSDSVATAEMDSLNIRRKGDLAYQGYMNAASFAHYKARYTREAGAFDWMKIGLGAAGAIGDAVPKIFGGSPSGGGSSGGGGSSSESSSSFGSSSLPSTGRGYNGAGLGVNINLGF